MVVLCKRAWLGLLPYLLPVYAQASGSGTTTRYWDCCKSSCSWPGKAALTAGSSPVAACDAKDDPLTNALTASACDGGSAYMCSNESPWAITSSLSYGFAAVNILGGTEASWCCACYELTFTSGPVSGKKMVVQATNTGGDLGGNQFDLAIPGGGFGLFDACSNQYASPATNWGAQYGGVSSRSQCDLFPEDLKDGCYWRFDWFLGADNPSMTFQQVKCPAALTARTGCIRADDSSFAPPPDAGSSSTSSRTSTTATQSTRAAGTPTIRTTTTTKVTQSTPAATTRTPTTTRTTTTTKITPSTPPATPPTRTPATTSLAKSPQAATAPATPAATAATQTKYGQCGGIAWTGPTQCAPGSTCRYGNDWYWQCL